jgi:hypothetical protein
VTASVDPSVHQYPGGPSIHPTKSTAEFPVILYSNATVPAGTLLHVPFVGAMGDTYRAVPSKAWYGSGAPFSIAHFPDSQLGVKTAEAVRCCSSSSSSRGSRSNAGENAKDTIDSVTRGGGIPTILLYHSAPSSGFAPPHVEHSDSSSLFVVKHAQTQYSRQESQSAFSRR